MFRNKVKQSTYNISRSCWKAANETFVCNFQLDYLCIFSQKWTLLAKSRFLLPSVYFSLAFRYILYVLSIKWSLFLVSHSTWWRHLVPWNLNEPVDMINLVLMEYSEVVRRFWSMVKSSDNFLFRYWLQEVRRILLPFSPIFSEENPPFRLLSMSE